MDNTYASTINNQMQAALSNVAAGLGQSIQLPLGSSNIQVPTNGAASILNSLSAASVYLVLEMYNC
jgi:hypothetical protein